MSAVVLDGYGPLVKQLPVLALCVIAVVLTAIMPTIDITSVPALIAAATLFGVATVLAAIAARGEPSRRFILLVPATDFLAAGVLRFATGESASVFASLVILPVIWVAASPGRRYVGYAFAGVCAGLLVPFALGATLEDNPNELARGLFSALAFGLAALVVNDLARLGREHLREMRARELTTRAELDQASAVQQALLPRGGMCANSYDFAGMCLPSTTISGDFFDWYRAGSSTAFTLGDVMGKGVGAGIIAATVRAVVRSARNHEDPSVALMRASESLVSDLEDTAAFATMFHGRLDESTGIVRYIDAGHGLTLHVHADGSWDQLTSPDLPVGIPFDEPWTINELQLQPGDTLVSCSDGILDLYDGSIESLDHVADIVAASTGATATVDRIRALIDDARENDDDITVLAVSRRPL